MPPHGGAEQTPPGLEANTQQFAMPLEYPPIMCSAIPCGSHRPICAPLRGVWS
jgi:hypothetical protein